MLKPRRKKHHRMSFCARFLSLGVFLHIRKILNMLIMHRVITLALFFIESVVRRVSEEFEGFIVVYVIHKNH